MTSKLADYIEAGKALNAEERLEAARQLLLSVESDADVNQTDIEIAWDDAIQRRVGEIESGEASLVDGHESHARVRAEVVALRK